MYVDTHCHLNFKDYATDRSEVITNAKKAGVKKMIVPGVNRFSTEEAIRLTEIYPGVISASTGFHPYEAQETDSGQIIKFIEETVKNNKIIALGECGLDYRLYKGHDAISKKDKQKILFDIHLRLALKYDLPVIIHCRDAYDEIFTVLDNLPSMPKGVFHCFGGGLSDLRMVLERGFYIGIDGNVTYSKSLQIITKEIPITRLLLETDAPNLTPVPFRGKRNEPKYISTIAVFISGLRDEKSENIGHQTSQNAINLFKLYP